MPRKKPAPTLKEALEALWNDSRCRSIEGPVIWHGTCSTRNGMPAQNAKADALHLTYSKSATKRRIPKCRTSRSATRA